MKKLFISFAALLLAVAAMADEKQVLVLTDGSTTTSILLDDQPVITIAGGNLVVSHGDGQTTEIALSTTLQFNVVKQDIPTGLDGLDGVVISRDGSVLTVQGARDVRLYDLAGTVLASAQGTAVIDLAGFAVGTFILKADNQTLKITGK